MFLASKVPDSYEASSLILFRSVIIASSSLFFASERLQKFQTAMKLSGLFLFRSPDKCLEFSRATFDSSSSSLLFASERLQKFQTALKLSVVNCHDECLEASGVLVLIIIILRFGKASKVSDSYETIRLPFVP